MSVAVLQTVVQRHATPTALILRDNLQVLHCCVGLGGVNDNNARPGP
jgi:hypothetical protein